MMVTNEIRQVFLDAFSKASVSIPSHLANDIAKWGASRALGVLERAGWVVPVRPPLSRMQQDQVAQGAMGADYPATESGEFTMHRMHNDRGDFVDMKDGPEARAIGMLSEMPGAVADRIIKHHVQRIAVAVKEEMDRQRHLADEREETARANGKPPLGPTPRFVLAHRRIRELSEAMQRQFDHHPSHTPDIDQMVGWQEEINGLLRYLRGRTETALPTDAPLPNGALVSMYPDGKIHHLTPR